MNDIRVSDENFCSCASIEDIGKTIPLVNKCLAGLRKDLDEEQRFQALEKWFKSFSGIENARIVSRETMPGYPPIRNFAFSFRDGESSEIGT